MLFNSYPFILYSCRRVIAEQTEIEGDDRGEREPRPASLDEQSAEIIDEPSRSGAIQTSSIAAKYGSASLARELRQYRLGANK